MKRQLYFLDWHLNKIQNSFGELQLVPCPTPKRTRQKLVVKQRNLWPGNTKGQSIYTPLSLGTHLTDPSNNVNGTKAAEVKFCSYPKLSLTNENQRVSNYLVERIKRVGIAMKPLAHAIKCMLTLSWTGNSKMKTLQSIELMH